MNAVVARVIAGAHVSTAFALAALDVVLIEQLMQKAQVRLENEIACISLNPTSNQPVLPEPTSAAMECDEGSKLDSLVAVGMWTDMTVSLTHAEVVRVLSK